MKVDTLKIEIPDAGESGTPANVEAFGLPETNYVQAVITPPEGKEAVTGSIGFEFSFDGENWHDVADATALSDSALVPVLYQDGFKVTPYPVAPKYVRVSATADFDGTATGIYCGTDSRAN